MMQNVIFRNFGNKINAEHYVIECIFKNHISSTKLRIVDWSPPLHGFVKLNVDGNIFANPSRSGFRGTIRNEHGGWLLGFFGSCGTSTNIFAKLLAIAKGLLFPTWTRGIELSFVNLIV